MIALTQRVVVDGRGERRDALDQRWCALLEALDCPPLLLPNHLSQARRLVERAAPRALVLTGGGDLAALGGDTPERDEVERWLVEHALASGTPLVGVCRGMQVLQHHLGVRLERVPGHVGSEHPVRGLLARERVNSFHEWGARDTCPELEVLAVADDGVVEAVRHRHAPLLGVMWHPERTAPVDVRDLDLLEQHLLRVPSALGA